MFANTLIVRIRSQVNMCIRHDHRALERSELLFGSLVYKSDFSKIYFFPTPRSIPNYVKIIIIDNDKLGI